MFPCRQVFVLACCSLAALARDDTDDVTLAAEPEKAVKGTMLFQSGRTVTSAPGVKLSNFDKFADLADDFDGDLLQEDLSPSEAVAAEASADIDEILIGRSRAKSTRSTWQPRFSFPRVLSCSAFCALFQDMFFVVFGIIGYYLWKCCHYTLPDIDRLRSRRRLPCSASGAADTTTMSSIDTDELVQAMYSENKEHLQKLLEERSTEATEEVWGCTALHVAAHCNNAPAAEALLLRGASSNMKDTWDETPLHFAARSGSAEVCELLLAYNADVNAVNARDWTPLAVAAHAGKEEICRLLLSRGAGVEGLSDADLPPLLSALLVQKVFEPSEHSVSTTKQKHA